MSFNVGKILKDVLHFFGNLFKHSAEAAEKDFEALPPETQEALKSGAGVYVFISQEVDKEPQIIGQDILTAFPELDETKLENGLYSFAHALNLAPNQNSIDDTIAKLQVHLKSLQGTVWDSIVEAGAKVFAFLVDPNKIEGAGNLIKYVYLKFFKKSV